MIFTRLNRASRPSSAIAMALVLAATGTLGMTALAEPAHAQKKKKEEAPKAQYSKEFVAAYKPIDEAMKAPTPDYAAVKALFPAALATVQSGDEKRAMGGVMYNVGNKLSDNALSLQGIELMLDSGTADPTLTGQLAYAGYQLHREAGNPAAARASLEKAIAANYSFNATMTDGSSRTIGADDMKKMIADLYFDQNQVTEGLAYISGLIDERVSAGEKIPEAWIRTGLVAAYENNINDQTPKYIAMLAENYPTDTTWGDAVIITLNAKNYQNAETLDLLRLSRRMNIYNDKRVLSEYVEVLDPRRYPGEVVAVIDQGFASGAVDKTDPYLIETRKEASGRVAADKAGLAALAKEARGASASVKTLVVAGDTFLSYDQPAEAEEFYTKALGMSGVETPLVLTRLGIAQYDQGKYAEAIESFRKVEGARRDLANLWAIYAAQKSAM